jgi:hypothetical protein
MSRHRLLAATLLASTAVLGQATPALRHGPIFGTFTNLRTHEETGDILGAELTVLPQYQTAYVIFQCAEGEATKPVFATAEVKGDTLRFTIGPDAGPCAGRYLATATRDGVSLHRDHAPPDVILPRKRSYWAQ